jgi:transcriptional regulator GlxA family with amidase domain
MRYEPPTELLAEWILTRSCETRRIASICTGIYALASTGLLDGREVTTHWRSARDVKNRFPALRVNHKRRLVRDGPFYTSAGLTAAVDLGLAFIEEDYGKQLADSVGRDLMMYLAVKGPADQNCSLASYETQPANRFGDLVAWIMKNLHHELTIEVMARHACMSPAHFARAFRSVLGTSPGQFVENLRLNEARRRLSSRRKTLGSIAAAVGFDSTVTFRRAFERRFGTRPANYLRGDVSRSNLKVRS